MWRYSQSGGQLSSQAGDVYGVGYSGHGEGVNNPKLEAVPNVGPIPKGVYNIGWSYTDAERGPMVMSLTPKQGTNTFGRSGFLMHGDLVAAPGKELASHGCIIMGPLTRRAVAASSDRELLVVE